MALVATIFSSFMVKAQSICPSIKGQERTKHGICIIYEGKVVGTNLNKVFAMHSVMKFPQALYVAEYLKKHSISLEDSILIKKKELKQDTWSPMMKLFDNERYFTYRELLSLSLVQSDNNACDILFKYTGSPKHVEKYIHKLGFSEIHIKLSEKDMGEKPALSAKNNSTPLDMAKLFLWLLEHKEKSEHLSFIWNTMRKCETGAERLPSLVPNGGYIVHKTGTGFTNLDKTTDKNDAGIIFLPNGKYMAIVAFIQHSKEEQDLARIAKEYVAKLTMVHY